MDFLIHSLRRHTIALRMVGAIGVVVLLLLLTGSAGLFGMFRLQALNEQVNTRATVDAQHLATLRGALAGLRLNERDMVLAYEQPAQVAAVLKQWQGTRAQADRAIDAMQAGRSAEEAALLAQMKSALAAYDESARPVVRQLEASGYDNAAVANRMLARARGAIDGAEAHLDALAALGAQARRQAHAEGEAAAQHTKLLFGGALLFAAVVVVPLTLANMVSICRPLEQARHLAEAIADGDLSRSPAVALGRDETAALQTALARMHGSLAGIVGRVHSAAESIQVASAEVASGNSDLSQRTEQAAGNLQQTASSVEQLTSNVRQSSDAAAQAHRLAGSASEVAQRGGLVVSQVVETMQRIDESSRRIADIIGTIDGIAFQTNILALNAAVEAARAGEQGRGFAVVAGEVRALAQRSAGAAREIKGLIEASVDNVAEGTRLVGDAGRTMQEIVDGVRRVSDIVGEISSAAAEQSGGIAQVNGAVAKLDRMTQQNAALVEQSAAAASSLKEQAAGLAGIVAAFRLQNPAASPLAATH